MAHEPHSVLNLEIDYVDAKWCANISNENND